MGITDGLRFTSCSLLALALLALPLSAQKATISFDPDQTVYDLDPGETQLIQATVCLPGVPVKADIYLLADVTTSMWPVLDQIKENASVIINALLTTTGVDIAVGLGSYRDFPYDAKPFDHQVSPTKNTGALVAAINTWNPAGGGDVSEGQFYALHKLATDPAIGFRPGAKRIILWFGDAPAHDPVCSIFNGFGTPTFPIDEALVKSSLAAAGPLGGTAVIAVGTPSSVLFSLALNDDPTLDSYDYGPFCGVGGTSGQADRIAETTGGISTSVTDPVEVTTAILDSVNSLLIQADVGCSVSGGIAEFVQSITPASYEDLVLPPDPAEELCVTFDVLLEGPPCAKMGSIYNGALEVSVNATPMATLPLQLKQPACKPLMGILWVGPRRLEPPVQFPEGGPTDLLQVMPTMIEEVNLEAIPHFNIPPNPALSGLDIWCQVGLYSVAAFPADPMKTSNGLVVVFDAPQAIEYGVESGLHFELLEPALVGGHLVLGCTMTN